MERILLTLLCSFMFILSFGKGEHEVVEYVDPTIGGASVLLQPTRQTIHLPNQMLRFVPLRKDMLDDWISDYPLQMVNHRMLWIFGFMPFCSHSTDGIWTSSNECDNEETLPYYYKSELDGVTLEFVPSCKSGIVRLKFSGNGEYLLRFRSLQQNGSFNLNGQILTGVAEFNGMKAFLYAKFDGCVIHKNSSKDCSHILLRVEGKNVIQMRYAISYISKERAYNNLLQEVAHISFDEAKAIARKIWVQRLSQIQVSGGLKKHFRTFYTALYRCNERMVDINEYGQYYSAWDHKVHMSDRPFYVDNWIWDTYIALEPLHIILNPQMEEDKISSYVEMYRQSGIMPSFAITTGDWPAMTGNFCSAWMADAWIKGLRFDLATAYEGLRKNSLEATLLPWRNGPRTELDDFYNANGYYPALHPNEKETIKEVDTNWEKRQSVAITTANSYSDWCIALLARQIGRYDDVQLFTNRAANYRNVFRVDKGFMWPKDKNGQWIEPFDPRYGARSYFTENNAYIFNWDVRHDFKGLFQLMGGREKAHEKLDQLFHEDLGMAKFNFFHILPDATGLVGLFQMGNEPGFHIPYLYNYVGAPWKTQKRIHQLIDAFFPDHLFGMPGDEDGGGMSAFVVFSMMGFFPVTPGIPVYSIGSPFFEKTTVRLPNGKSFTIKAHQFSTQNKYIQSARLNGKLLSEPWLRHNDLVSGGYLELIMGNQPNRSWGANASFPEE